mmetsp:Transcript_23123/g.22574  ORF Transcript_23123/g.22574 Transcript_23123/m.22574 type:complete len:108 (+) Transcript_23123:3281-3604(+)
MNIKVVNWHERVKQGPVLLKVIASTKEKKKVTVRVSFESENSNAKIPVSFLKHNFVDVESKVLGHIMKIDPSKPWGDIKVKVEINEKSDIPPPPVQVNQKGTHIPLN